jgi:hypothetical protein
MDLPREETLPEKDLAGAEPRCILLIARDQLTLLRGRIDFAGVRLVLKPVNQALLRGVLEEALSEHESRQAVGAAEQMRLERDELLQHLLHANLRLQEYDQDRTNFLTHSVHDLRAPLTAVQGYCSLLIENQLGPLNPEQRNVLERMERSVRRLFAAPQVPPEMAAGDSGSFARRQAAPGRIAIDRTPQLTYLGKPCEWRAGIPSVRRAARHASRGDLHGKLANGQTG